ncbi:hypothetical protein BN8_05925 [Fibrisoma limi BUZ 3]|uniref:Uncharacterized protein n=1 Tax=Fibrisoma limi BUZ 3 TaxID=1185876 RepID=I2GRN9_9BACT|nr:hypothetical protein BN8_05925 [Fibrisoma limi BUZ 3]
MYQSHLRVLKFGIWTEGRRVEVSINRTFGY